MRRGRAVGRAVLWAVALLLGCSREPDFETGRGVAVYLDGAAAMSREQAEQMEEYLLRQIAHLGYPVERSLQCVAQAEVRVVETTFTCFDGQRRCAGEQWDRLLVVAAAQCPYASAYVHELAHWLQQCVRDRYDPEHQERALWEAVAACPLRCEP